MQKWNAAQMAAQQEQSYHEFLRIPTMSLGLYRLPAGGVDLQKPHVEDEAYYVVSGRAAVEVEGEQQDVQPGDIIFVPAHADHRFKSIQEDLVLLVFFAPAESAAP